MTRLNYTLDEAATALGIGKTKLRELITSGKLRAVRIGDKPLLRLTEFERFMNTLEVAA